MAVRRVLRMGDPFLLRQARDVEDFASGALHRLVEDMFDTMEALNGAGLAAPQIGVGLRVVVFEVVDNPRYPEAETIPRTVLVNPKLEPINEETEQGWEGCLSVPGLRGLVPRYRSIRYRGHDQHGNPVDQIVEGFHARLVQHECDHLDGVLYPHRMEDMHNFGFTDELFASVEPPGKVE